MTDAHSCVLCADRATNICGGCSGSRYCSAVCQQADWETHKLLCKCFKTFVTPPMASSRRAILFPDSEPKPRFIWLNAKTVKSTGDEQASRNDQHVIPAEETAIEETELDFASHFGPSHLKAANVTLAAGGAGDRTIIARHRDNFLSQGGKPNQSIATVTDGGTMALWRGPAVLFARNAGGDCINCEPSDMRAILAGFQSHYAEWSGDRFSDAEHAATEKARGVVVNCSRDLIQYEEIDVPLEHPVFKKKGVRSPIADHLGIPLLTYQYPRSKLQTAYSQRNEGTAPPASYLHLSLDPDGINSGSGTTAEWAQIPKMWRECRTSVLVVSESKNAVLPIIVEFLCVFCRDTVHPEFNDLSTSGSEDEVTARREHCLKQVDAEAFGAALKQWLELKDSAEQADRPDDSGGQIPNASGVEGEAVVEYESSAEGSSGDEDDLAHSAGHLVLVDESEGDEQDGDEDGGDDDIYDQIDDVSGTGFRAAWE